MLPFERRRKGDDMAVSELRGGIELTLPLPPLFQVCANAARSSSLLQFPPSTVSGDRMRAPYPKSMRAFMRRPVNGARSTCAFGNLKIAFLGSGPPARFSIGRLSGTVEHRESPEREREEGVSLTHPLLLPR